MSETLMMSFFAFGAVLILISLLARGFSVFSAGISSTTSNPIVRITSFVLASGCILMALHPAMVLRPVVDPTQTRIPAPPINEPPIPPASQTRAQPRTIYATPTPAIPSPTDFVISYWQNVSDGRYEIAWMQLSPRFQQATHNSSYNDYINDYQRTNLCRIVISNLNLIRQAGYSAVVTAHFTYYTGHQCNSSEYDFEMWLVYDGTNNSWLFDRNISEK